MEKINQNLISIKCVLFLFFAGLGCLFPFLPLHMLETGLTLDEARIVSIVAPCVALIGPVLIGPLVDKLAGSSGGNSKSKFGRYLRTIIAIVLILAAVFYLLLLTVPTVTRFKARRPSVTFTSDPEGGIVLQERCMEEKSCHHWSKEKKGSLVLSNCRYACHTPPTSRKLKGNMTENDDSIKLYPEDLNEPTETSEEKDAPESETPGNEYETYGDVIESDFGENYTDEDVSAKRKRQSTPIVMEMPHLCYIDKDGVVMCQVYTENTKNISIEVSLLSANNSEDDDEEWCKYPLGGYFSGRISENIAKTLVDPANNSCRPVIQCDVEDPYDSPDSVLAESQCVQVIGDPETTFWTYLFIRSIADIFPTTALVLLDAAVIIATRETSTGRGDVGRQLAWGTLGFAIFAPIVGTLVENGIAADPVYLIAIVLFAVAMVSAALILLFAKDMPLSPPEWWWHTKCGMLALPMSSVRRYGSETAALIFIILLLGIFWSALDSYMPWHVTELSGTPLLIGLTITIGTLPAFPFLWYAERVVDYCGHSNLLITAFTMYIIRYTVMAMISSPWLILICESLEVFTLILMWVTVVLYLRHLIPRRFTATGQALPVIAHFCIGRCIGAIIGGLVNTGSTLDSLRTVYQWMAISAAVIAVVYFCLYHMFLKQTCAAASNGPPRSPPTIMQTMNGNGSYTPLRVYHNGRARKGQFRY